MPLAYNRKPISSGNVSTLPYRLPSCSLVEICYFRHNIPQGQDIRQGVSLFAVVSNLEARMVVKRILLLLVGTAEEC